MPPVNLAGPSFPSEHSGLWTEQPTETTATEAAYGSQAEGSQSA